VLEVWGRLRALTATKAITETEIAISADSELSALDELILAGPILGRVPVDNRY
jgi:hypothetical protein